MKKKNIALVTGGYSEERVISMLSSSVAEKHIDTDLFNVYKIVLYPESWYYEAPTGEQIPVNRADFSITWKRKKVRFDAALIILHGTPGEDGKLQGYFDIIGLPYTSCDTTTSSLTFNKRYTVAVAAFAGIPVAKSLHLFKKTPLSSVEILSQLQLPVFVKPNNGGSSIGMSKVSQAHELTAALEKAFLEDDQVLVEEFIKGREFTIGVFRSKGEIIAFPITEIVSTKEFFDYEAKYTTGAANEITPAPIPNDKTEIIQDAARKIYTLFNCSGAVRVDFIWNDADNQPYMLEINTVPGQTENSLLPQQIRAYGWTMKEFYTQQIEETLHRNV